MARPSMRHALLSTLVLLTSATDVAAQSTAEQLLRRPVSPVAEALLVPYASDRRVVERWADAVADSSADVRMVVARAIQAGGLVDLVEPMATQLAVESDLGAAVEQAEALVVLTRDVHPAIRAAADRLGGPVAASAIRALGRAAPAVLAREAGAWRSLGREVELAHTAVLSGWLRFGNPDAARMQNALMREGTPEAWRVLVAAAIETAVPLPASRVALALRSSDPDVIDQGLAAALDWPDGEISALKQGTAAGDAYDTLLDGLEMRRPSTRLLAILLGRRAGWPRQELPLAEAGADAATSRLVAVLTRRQLETLDRSEIEALWAAWGWDKSRRGRPGRNPLEADTSARQFLHGLPGGIWHATFDAEGCWQRGTFLTGRISYGPDGTVTAASADGPRASGRCRAAAEALLRLTRVTTAGEHALLIPADKAFGRRFAARPLREVRWSDWWIQQVDGDLEMPVLVKSVKPAYPRSAKSDLTQGSVLLAAVIDADGSVVEAGVIKAIDRRLNTAAALALGKWRFQPALENGTSVPFLATIEMEFRLR